MGFQAEYQALPFADFIFRSKGKRDKDSIQQMQIFVTYRGYALCKKYQKLVK